MEKLHRNIVVEEQVSKARQEIIDNLPIEKYLLDKKLLYTSEGKTEGKIVCPVHEDNNPSCFYNNDKNVYHCFSCGSKGSVVELDFGIHARNNDKESLVKAILRLSREYDIAIPDMFNREKKKAAVRKDIAKFRRDNISPEQENRIYERKLERIETQIRTYPKEVRHLVYHNCDRVLLGEISSKEMFVKIENYLKNLEGIQE